MLTNESALGEGPSDPPPARAPFLANALHRTNHQDRSKHMKTTSKTWTKLLLAVACSQGLVSTALAATYTWRGTNSTVWADSGNWLARNIAPTNGAYPHRLEVNNAAFNPMVYDAGQGTTIYGTTGIRGLVIASGASGSGTMTISGGTFITTNTSAGDVLQNTSGNRGTLNINGGTFVSDAPQLDMGLGTGANTIGFLNVNSGLATLKLLRVNCQQGTINYNGGTTSFSNMTAVITGGGTCTNNFNGGVLKPRANHTAFIPNLSQANVRDGGALFDTAGFSIKVVAPLAHSVIEGDAAVDGGLSKLGEGILTLQNAPSYTGPTRVQAGTLATPLPQTSSALVLAPGARFSTTVSNTAWTMTSAALTNATVDLNYGSWPVNSYGSAVMNLGSLALSGSVTCNIVGSGFPVTSLTLFTYSGKTGGGSFVLGALPFGAVATLTDDGANVVLNLTAPSIQNLTWTFGDGIWQTNGGLNWNFGAATYLEYPSGVNDLVTFDDMAGGGTVTLGSVVKPSSTTVSAEFSDYLFSGAGSIAGTNGITKSGSAALTIANANTYTGPTLVNGGTLKVAHVAALGATNGGTIAGGAGNTPADSGMVALSGGLVVSDETITLGWSLIGANAVLARGSLRGTDADSNVWNGPVVIASSVPRIGTEDNASLTVSGPITDNGLNYGVLIRPGANSTVTLSGSGSSYAFTRTYGHGDGTGVLKLGAPDALCTNRLELGLGVVDLNGFNQTLGGIIDVSGNGTILNHGAGPCVLTINTTTNSLTWGSVTDGLSPLALVKLGSGKQTLTGVNLTYSGTTTIKAGQLDLTSANPMNTAITVESGGTLGGEGSTTNSLTLEANAIVSVNPTTAGSFTADTINASASPIKVAFTAPPTTDVLVLGATNGITGLAANFQTIGMRGGSFYLTNGNTELMFSPSAAPASLVWQGNDSAHPTFWDTFTTTNWSNGGTPDLFYAADHVAFDDSASSFLVAIQGASVLPSSVTVNSTNDYSFTGAISGAASVAKGGTGTLLFNNSHSYTGVTTITNGVLAIQTSGGLGTAAGGTVIAEDGTLDINTGAAFANTINLGAELLTISGNGYGGRGVIVNSSLTASQINAVQQILMAGHASIGGDMRWDMRGTGNTLDMQTTNTLTKIGVNQISLVGTYVNNPGHIVVSNGIFNIELGATLNGWTENTLTVHSGATLGFWAFTGFAPWTLTLHDGATVFGSSGASSANHWAGPVTVNGAVTLDASGGYLTFDGQLSGPGSIIKTGNLGVALTAANAYAGDTTVNAGTLTLGFPTLATNSTVSVATNAALELNFFGTNVVASLVLNGISQPPGVYDAVTATPYLTGTGALEVVTTEPPVLQFANLGGGQLQFSWTGAYKLQAQTNALSIGISNNWADYPGGGSSPVTVPVDPAQGSVFFRLVSP
jgi:fibronectin-binding autotransporter adhesin